VRIAVFAGLVAVRIGEIQPMNRDVAHRHRPLCW
jgi:hypothetical protein